MKYTVQYNKQKYQVDISDNNIAIYDSYKITSLSDMKQFLIHLKARFYPYSSINNRTMFSLLNEWRTHNLLYSLGVQKERTASVDLESNQSWYMTVAYAILSPFYLHFY